MSLHCHFSHTDVKLKPGPGTRVITTGYPVPKTSNAANHYYLHYDIWYDQLSLAIPVWMQRVLAKAGTKQAHHVMHWPWSYSVN